MTNFLDLAARLEAACDIAGKPIGRHMVEGVKAMADAFTEMDTEKGRDMGETHGILASCIDNEAKLFDALAIVAKEAAEVLRAAASGQSLLQPATTRAQKVCHCKGTCGAPIIMGRPAPCIMGYKPGQPIVAQEPTL